jgi:hypothetical protein
MINTCHPLVNRMGKTKTHPYATLNGFYLIQIKARQATEGL